MKSLEVMISWSKTVRRRIPPWRAMSSFLTGLCSERQVEKGRKEENEQE
jgi:hypothetical protein